MKSLVSLLAIAGFAAAAVNTSREYTLHTEVKHSTAASKQFNNLYVFAYHTGAGLNDATVGTYNKDAAKGFLNATKGHLNNQLFDLGSDFPYAMDNVLYETFYAGWQPIRINAGSGGNDEFTSGFFINKTGLQWTTTPAKPGGPSDQFGGWLVCRWWHGVPQLFVRLAGYDTQAPQSCADVYLVPHYL